jgi:hypothetical protein
MVMCWGLTCHYRRVMSGFEKYSIFDRINAELATQGLLFNGTTPHQVSGNAPYDVVIDDIYYKVEVLFTPETTTEQRNRTQVVIDSVSKQEKKIKSKETMLEDLENLRQSDVDILVKHLIIDKLGSDPSFARRAGVDIDGDEDVDALKGR